MNEATKLQASPEMVEGPFYSSGGEQRAQLRGGQPGQALDLVITVVHAVSGMPLASVDIDLWHCNATGRYSGYDVDPDQVPDNISNGQPATNNETFLRGMQTTDRDGKVTFQTIVPGWYALRTPHIHLKIFEGDVCNTTTQLFLPENLNQTLKETPEYARSGQQDTFNNTDPIIGKIPADASSIWIDIHELPSVYIGAATVKIVPGNVNELIIVPPGRIPPLGGQLHDKPVK